MISQFFYLLFYYDSLITGNLCTVLGEYEVIVSLGVQFVTIVFYQSHVYISLLSCCPLTKRQSVWRNAVDVLVYVFMVNDELLLCILKTFTHCTHQLPITHSSLYYLFFPASCQVQMLFSAPSLQTFSVYVLPLM